MTVFSWNGKTYDTAYLSSVPFAYLTPTLSGAGNTSPWIFAAFEDALVETGLRATGGVSGYLFDFNASTAGTDPGPGTIAFNNAALASSTAAVVDILQKGGSDISAWLAAMSGAAAIKGDLTIRSLTTNTKFASWTVTAVTNSTGFYTLTLGSYTGPTPAPTFTAGEALGVTFGRAGPAGSVSAASDGTISAPGISFASESGLGIRRKSAGVAALTASSADLLELRPATLVEAQAGSNTLAVMTPQRVSDAILALARLVNRSTRGSNTALTTTDRGNLIDATTGGFTQTIVAAATLTAGWFVYYRNSSTGVVTIDPNASETIDGRTTINVYPGETLLIMCDGTGFTCVGRDRWVNLGTTTVGSAVATVDLETGFTDSEIVNVFVKFSGVSGSSTGSLRGRLKGAGAYITTSDYYWGGVAEDTGTVAATNSSGANASINFLGATYTAAGTQRGVVELTNIQTGSTGGATYVAQTYGTDGPAWTSLVGNCISCAAVQGIRFFYSAGNIDAGTFQVWGQRA